jgi:hypothetical protein
VPAKPKPKPKPAASPSSSIDALLEKYKE